MKWKTLLAAQGRLSDMRFCSSVKLVQLGLNLARVTELYNHIPVLHLHSASFPANLSLSAETSCNSCATSIFMIGSLVSGYQSPDRTPQVSWAKRPFPTHSFCRLLQLFPNQVFQKWLLKYFLVWLLIIFDDELQGRLAQLVSV